MLRCFKKLKQGLLWLVCLAIGLALFVAPFSAVAGQSYINGIDANFPPFAYVDESGEPSSFDVDAVEWIAEEMGFEVFHWPDAEGNLRCGSHVPAVARVERYTRSGWLVCSLVCSNPY